MYTYVLYVGAYIISYVCYTYNEVRRLLYLLPSLSYTYDLKNRQGLYRTTCQLSLCHHKPLCSSSQTRVLCPTSKTNAFGVQCMSLILQAVCMYQLSYIMVPGASQLLQAAKPLSRKRPYHTACLIYV